MISYSRCCRQRLGDWGDADSDGIVDSPLGRRGEGQETTIARRQRNRANFHGGCKPTYLLSPRQQDELAQLHDKSRIASAR